LCQQWFISCHELDRSRNSQLQPVLNSYWLMIHVAVGCCYGPFALGWY
jgi:ABC-type transport system involved in cytochrome c biogenesis permease subunit